MLPFQSTNTTGCRRPVETLAPLATIAGYRATIGPLNDDRPKLRGHIEPPPTVNLHIRRHGLPPSPTRKKGAQAKGWAK